MATFQFFYVSKPCYGIYVQGLIKIMWGPFVIIMYTSYEHLTLLMQGSKV